MNTKRFLCAALGAVCYFAFLQAQVRTEQTFEKGWKFTREDNAEFANPGYNDSKWQNVTVPHDWAIYGPFSINNDKQEMAITQDGQTEAMEHAGRTGGLPFVGTGWYRLNFDAPGFEKGKKATLIFDGAMSHARVYVNGQEAGYWPYGYNSFYVDATPYLKPGEKNELAVRLENEPESSRWYPGAGLYRNVHLVINEDTHIPAWGTYATTPVVTDKYAKVSLKTSLVSPEGANMDNYRIVTQIKDKNGKVVATGENKLSVFDNTLFEQEFAVANPELWSPETPVLYMAESKVYEGNTLKDEYTTRFGIRTLEIIPDKGFFLNGKLTKFKGVCNHHDWPVIYDVSNYNAGLKYSTFIASDNPYTEIENKDLSDGSSCIVVKESFGNAFIPFLVDHYQTVYVVDYRYWTGSISKLAQDKNVNDVLFLNNLSMIRNKSLVGKLYRVL